MYSKLSRITYVLMAAKSYRAYGVVVSRLLRMQKASGSIPDMSTLFAIFSRYYIHRCANDTGNLPSTFPMRSSSNRESIISTTVSQIVTDFSKPLGKNSRNFQHVRQTSKTVGTEGPR